VSGHGCWFYLSPRLFSHLALQERNREGVVIALRLVRLIESHSDSISKNLAAKFRASTRTAEMGKITETELLSGMHELLLHLSEWLLMKTDAEVEKRYRAIGGSLRSQDIAFADACWTITMTKEHLWEFLQKQGFLRSPVELYGEMELLCLLDQFFDRALCYTAEGYEEEQRQQSRILKEPHKQQRELNPFSFVP
jgi:hypothetical protein